MWDRKSQHPHRERRSEMNEILAYLFFFSVGLIAYVTWLHSQIDLLRKEVRFLARYVKTPEE